MVRGAFPLALADLPDCTAPLAGSVAMEALVGFKSSE